MGEIPGISYLPVLVLPLTHLQPLEKLSLIQIIAILYILSVIEMFAGQKTKEQTGKPFSLRIMIHGIIKDILKITVDYGISK